MKNKFKDFHHYKGSGLTRFEKVERKVIQLILSTNIPDQKREDSQIFEFMHAAGVTQIGRILAQKRKLNVELTSTACVLHDIYVITKGIYKNHAKLGGPIAEKILKEIGGFSDEEIQTIINAVSNHSKKEIYTDDPYIELVKDADVFDCSLYKNAEGFYQLHKPENIFQEYVNRIKKVRDELKLPAEPVFR
ncbi:MAG: HD domain-containing protein [Candidatus Levyibacteriota bacterium]|nr:MAG: HD domain-containing protein [Candidatus Levybacteria bacterium]